ncbi:MAG TPA: hypothetical protein VFB95_12180 [Candidatus Cryosericum sp.]|nr:hypothetical protein [Candidatus Cryosericum sp.]
MTVSHLAAMLGSLSAAAAFLLILMAAGARLRTTARLPLPADLKAPFDWLCGCWLYGTVALLAGLSGFFRSPVLLGLVALLAAAGRWRRTGWRPKSLYPPLIACLVLAPVALARPFFYDALVYHLALPWQSLLEGRIAAHSEDLFSVFPPLAQLVFAAPVAAGIDRAAALVHLGAFVMGGSAVAILAQRLGAPPVWARSAGALLPLLPAIVPVPGFAAAEGFAVGGVIAALAIALGGLRPTGRRPTVGAGERHRTRSRVALAAAAAAGLLVGIATAARLQGLSWTLIVLLVVGIGPAPRARRLIMATAGFIGGSAPWWLKNLVLLGDPLAPIAWRRPGIETLWRDSRGLAYLASGAGDLGPALWAAARPHLLYVGPLLLAAVFAVVSIRGRRAPVVLLAAALGTVAWLLTGSLARFWTPSLALLLALAAAASVTPAGRWLGGLAISITTILGLTHATREAGNLGGLRLLLGGDAAAHSLIISDPLPAFEAAAALPSGTLPRDALVLFVAEARSYGFPRPCIVPSQHDVPPLREWIETQPDAAAVRDRLRERGITHLLVNRAEMARLARDYPVLPWETPLGQTRFQELLDLCGAPIAKAGETAIFALR